MLQVEKAPVVIKTGVSKADAAAMQKQLEAGEAACSSCCVHDSLLCDSVYGCTVAAPGRQPACMMNKSGCMQPCISALHNLHRRLDHRNMHSTAVTKVFDAHCLCTACAAAVCHAVGGKVVME
jgi:hypothetical protein